MDESYYMVKHRLVDYLEKSRIPIMEAEDGRRTVLCPCCKGTANVIVIPLDEVQSSWSCPDCGSKGDAVKYAQEYFCLRNETQALQDVCRKLGVPVTVLDTVSAKTLLSRETVPIPELIKGLVGPGLYILAGSPKIGKSWMVLDWAITVSKGDKLWDLQTTKSDVLYLALEDAEHRLENRLRTVLDGEVGNIYFATDVEPIENGFVEQISAFLESNKGVKLVIVDTFGRARGSQAAKHGYAEDYALMAGIKRLAMRFDVTIILVHHTKKKEEDDIMAMISGTNGIFGCADGGMVLHRADRMCDEATLYTTGRDFEDQKFAIKLNKDNMRWELSDCCGSSEQNEIVAAVASYAKTVGFWEGTATGLLGELVKIDIWLKSKPNGLARALNANKKYLRDTYNVEYRKGRADNEKLIMLIDLEHEKNSLG